MEAVQVKTIDIRDTATVRTYYYEQSGTLDLACQSMDIFLFCLKQGHIRLHTSFIPHPIELHSGEAIFLAFPKDQWQVRMVAQPGSILYTTQMEASKLHKLINPVFDTHQLDHTSRVNMKDLMKLIAVNPSLLGCFDQLVNHKLQLPFSLLFEQAKFLEIFSLIMESAFGQHLDSCPVMISPAIENKLHQVRRHIMDHIDVVPDPDQLAVIYELPRNTLREGYRYVFGKSIHQYHADHKLESAMQMLASGELLVKEIAFRIGYQNPSHFISAFKKKYGYTPKQYLKKEVAVG